MTSSISGLSGASLISYYQGQAALGLFGASSSSGASSSAAALTTYYEAKEGLGASSSASSIAASNAPAAPWNTSGGTPSVSSAVANAMDGESFVNTSAAKLSAPGGSNSSDYQNLFALYQGLNTLQDLAQTAIANGTATSTTYSDAQLQSVFANGLGQIEDFLNTTPFTGFNVSAGKVTSSEQSAVGIPTGSANSQYTTGIVYTGDLAAPAPAFAGDLSFNISVTNTYSPAGTAPTVVNINLDNMGSTPRTMTSVVNFINSQLKAAGVSTTFSVASLGNATNTSFVDGQTTTTTGDPQYGFTINGSAGEQVSFSSSNTAAAVYVAQSTGGAKTMSSTGTQTTTTQAEQLFGLQTNNSAVGAPPSTASVSSNNSNVPVNGVFATGLPSGVTSVQAETVGSDGSIYMVANVSGSVSGANVPGTQGVALLKYDSEGKLIYTKVLADGSDASGYGLSVNSNGEVAVVGSNSTAASVSANGVPTKASTTGFVQVFNPDGSPDWSATIPASGGTSTATGVAFGSDGSVYVSGTTTGSVGGQVQQGTSDAFIQGYNPTGTATFTTQYGPLGGDSTSGGLVYDTSTNSLYALSDENSQAVVRNFALNGANAPTQTASRALGNVIGVVGIGLSGNQVVVGGNVAGATIHASTTAQAFQGVQDSFVASIDKSLTATSTDNVTYQGVSGGTETATGMAVAGGQAYLTGTIASDPGNMSYSGATEGFVSGVDTTSGAVTLTSKFTATGGQSAPQAIAASATGTSALNVLGLPQGAINAAGSNLIVGNTPIQAGDAFYIRTSPNGPQATVTIGATDTVTTLINKINTALGASGKASVITLGSTAEISITPTDTSSYIELDSQPANPGLASVTSNSTDVLSSLGLSQGVIRQQATINGLTDPSQLREYGLNLTSSMNISTTASAQSASNILTTAIAAIQQAYQDLVNPPTLASEEQAQAQNSAGTAPAYLTAELANYQAGLSRLTAGSSGGSGSSTASLLG